MGTHRSKTARSTSNAGKWYALALFSEYSLIGTIWLLGMVVMIGARSFSVILYSFTLVIAISVAYAATHLRGMLRALVLAEDQTSGTGRKSSNAPTRHRTASA